MFYRIPAPHEIAPQAFSTSNLVQQLPPQVVGKSTAYVAGYTWGYANPHPGNLMIQAPPGSTQEYRADLIRGVHDGQLAAGG